MKFSKRKFGHFMIIFILIININYLLAEEKNTEDKNSQVKNASKNLEQNILCFDKSYIREVAQLLDNLIGQNPEFLHGLKM